MYRHHHTNTKGTGGNTVVCHCIIVKQAAVAEETIELRKGVHLIWYLVYYYEI